MKNKLAIDGGTPIRSKENFLVFGAPKIEEAEIAEVVGCVRPPCFCMPSGSCWKNV